MENILNIIEQLRAELESLMPVSSENQAKLNKKFRLEFNYNSNHLEGNTLTYKETEQLLIKDIVNGGHTGREIEEMKAHDVALDLIKEWAKDTERPLSEKDIKELNKLILVKPFWSDARTPNGQATRREIKIGTYKEMPNSVILQNGEIFEYASPSDTPIKMGELIQWYRNEEQKNELHPIALAAILHYKFVLIHPFDDGNGRVSRLLMNYVLYKNNLPPVVIKSADKKNYLQALGKADTGDINSFIAYIAEQLIWSLELSIKAAKGESIEEVDDLDKEIELFKKQVKARKKERSISRSDKVIAEMYITYIQDLFNKFEERNSQFTELFLKTSILYCYNNQGNDALSWVSSELARNFSTDFGSPLMQEKINSSQESTNIDSLRVVYNFNNYIFLKEKSFSLISEISFIFETYMYKIHFANQTIEKPYNEYLTTEEQEMIVATCVKSVFEQIKKKSGGNN